MESDMTMTNPASQAIAALLVGLLTSFTCQLLLTNLGLALGITIWGGLSRNPGHDSSSENADVNDSESAAVSLGTISLAAGLGLLLTINSVMFVACYVAVKFCTPATASAGAILGWLVWSAYLLIMTWVSTRAANSLVAFIFSSAVSGLRQIFAVLGSLAQSAFDDQAAPLTPTAAANLVHRETQLALEQIDIPTLIEEYIDERMPSQLQLADVQPQLENTWQQADLGGAEQRGFLSQVNLNTFAQWVEDEIGLSGNIADAIADLLNQVWQRLISSQASPWEQLQELFATAAIGEFIPEQISQVLERLQQENSPAAEPSIAGEPNPSGSVQQPEKVAGANSPDDISRQLKQILRQRSDLTDEDIQIIWRQMGPLLPDWQADATPSLEPQTLREDVDDYLQQVFPWRLNHALLEQEFLEVLIDPDADPEPVLAQLQRLSAEKFADSLQQRGDLVAEQIEQLVADLEAIRQSAIARLKAAINQGHEAVAQPELDSQNGASPTAAAATDAITELQQKLENYLHYTSLSQITDDAISQKVEALVEDSSVAAVKLHRASPHLPSEPLIQVLDSRQGLESAQRDQLIQQVQSAWQRVTAAEAIADKASQRDFLKPPRRWALRRSTEARDFWDNVTEYLEHSQPDQLTPAAVRHNLAWLWQASGQALDALPDIMTESADTSGFDWRQLKDTLAHRQDLATEQMEAIWSALEQFMQSLMHQANQARQQAQASFDAWLASAKAVLRDAKRQAFDPDHLKANLRELLQHPPDILTTLVQPLNLLDAPEDTAAAIAQLSQNVLQQLLTAQGVPKALLAQAAGLKTWMQERITVIQQNLQRQQAALKQAALQQLENTRKALATAAWWLFAIALTSGTTATMAGILATKP